MGVSFTTLAWPGLSRIQPTIGGTIGMFTQRGAGVRSNHKCFSGKGAFPDGQSVVTVAKILSVPFFMRMDEKQRVNPAQDCDEANAARDSSMLGRLPMAISRRRSWWNRLKTALALASVPMHSA